MNSSSKGRVSLLVVNRVESQQLLVLDGSAAREFEATTGGNTSFDLGCREEVNVEGRDTGATQTLKAIAWETCRVTPCVNLRIWLLEMVLWAYDCICNLVRS